MAGNLLIPISCHKITDINKTYNLTFKIIMINKLHLKQALQKYSLSCDKCMLHEAKWI